MRMVPGLVAFAFLLLFAGCTGERPSSSSSSTATATEPAASSSTATDALVRAADDELARAIRQRASFEQMKGDLSELTTEGGEFTAYFDGGALRLADVALYGETGKLEASLLYDADRRLRAADRIESRYDEPFGKVVQTQRARFHLYDDAVIRIVVDGREADVGNEPWRTQARNLIELARHVAASARRP
ncbi:MAG TPA: hypothetical protein VFV95_07525 [Vicinamibacterales bacterium]|nr:hypothetical protein [Vicinamibacterales bacterium]